MKAVSSVMPRKLSNWPAKFAPLRSSISAEERTANGFCGPAPALCQASRSASRIARRDRLFVEREPDLDGKAALLAHIRRAEPRQRLGEPEGRDLRAIGIRSEAEAARRRQPGARQRRKIRRLGADPLGIARRRARERHDERIEPAEARCSGGCHVFAEQYGRSIWSIPSSTRERHGPFSAGGATPSPACGGGRRSHPLPPPQRRAGEGAAITSRGHRSPGSGRRQ